MQFFFQKAIDSFSERAIIKLRKGKEIKKMKTREEKIRKLENKRFFLAMKDNWTRKDFERDEELRREIEELKKN